jgi:hypothetical protein
VTHFQSPRRKGGGERLAGVTVVIDIAARGHDGQTETLDRPTVSPDDVVDLLLTSLSGAMLTRVLLLTAHSADNLRNVLLRQVAEVLGRAL